MTFMKKPAGLALVLLGLLAVLLGAYHFWSATPLPSTPSNDTPPTTPTAGSAGPKRDARHVAVLARDAAGSLAIQDADVRAMFSGDPRLIALSEEEAAWLDRHHYPTQDDLDSLSKIDIDALRGTKDPRQAMLQGLALVKKGEVAGGLSVLDKAAALGATYAYGEGAIAAHLLMKQRLGGRNLDSDNILMARLEVSRILGDHTVEYLIDTHLPDYDSRRNAYAVQRHVTEFLRQLGMEAQLLGVPPPGPDPRPNAELWRDLYELYRLQQAGGG